MVNNKIVNNNYWSTVIEPRDKFLDLDLKAVWQKKYLLWLFIKRDIVVQFKQTIFGMGWYFISPLISTAIYIIIFSRVAGIPTDGIPQPLFYLSGVCLWNYFSSCLTKTSTTFATNSNLFGKVYFPRLVAPMSFIVSQLFHFSIQMMLFVVVYIGYACYGVNVHPNIYLLLFPLVILGLGGLALGIGLIVTSMTTKYKDFVNFFPTLVSLWMYATPVVFPLSYVENPTLKVLMTANPVTPLIETFKFGAFGEGTFTWLSFGYSFLCMFVLMFIGMIMYNRKQKRFIDTI